MRVRKCPKYHLFHLLELGQASCVPSCYHGTQRTGGRVLQGWGLELSPPAFCAISGVPGVGRIGTGSRPGVGWVTHKTGLPPRLQTRVGEDGGRRKPGTPISWANAQQEPKPLKASFRFQSHLLCS